MSQAPVIQAEDHFSYTSWQSETGQSYTMHHDLGVLLHREQSVPELANSLCRSCYFRLHQKQVNWHNLLFSTAHTFLYSDALVIPSFQACSNSEYLIQNASMCPKLRSPTTGHLPKVSRVLDNMNNAFRWFQVEDRIKFKNLLLVWASLNSKVLTYIRELYVPVQSQPGHIPSCSSKSLSSAVHRDIQVPRFCTST